MVCETFFIDNFTKKMSGFTEGWRTLITKPKRIGKQSRYLVVDYRSGYIC